MKFGHALELLKDGKKITRKGWNGKGMFLYYVSEDKYPAKMDAAKELADKEGLVEYGPYIAMKTSQGYVTPWVASQIDLLSEDWETINTKEDLTNDATEIQRILSKGYHIEERSSEWGWESESSVGLYLVNDNNSHEYMFLQKKYE